MRFSAKPKGRMGVTQTMSVRRRMAGEFVAQTLPFEMPAKSHTTELMIFASAAKPVVCGCVVWRGSCGANRSDVQTEVPDVPGWRFESCPLVPEKPGRLNRLRSGGSSRDRDRPAVPPVVPTMPSGLQDPAAESPWNATGMRHIRAECRRCLAGRRECRAGL